MSTIEQPTEQTIDNDNVDPFLAHLYDYEGPPTRDLTRVAECGLVAINDKHAFMHWDNDTSDADSYWYGENRCPSCGAPVCPTCYAKSTRSTPWT